MRRTERAGIVLIAVVAMAMVVAAQTQAPQQQAPQQQAPPQNAPISGEIVSVDADDKELVIKTADGEEAKFLYTDKTEVSGAKEGLAGLANMKAAKVTVHFTVDAKSNAKTATRIEVQQPRQ